MKNIFALTSIAAATTLVLSTSAFAGWNSSQESMGGKSTWIYTPNSSIAGNSNIIDGKRALVINLHGCSQTATQLKDNGGWEAAAETYGAIIAVPDVGNGYIAGCWNYDGGNDNSSHSAAIVDMVDDFLADSSLNIDPNQVYVTGLSSGAGLALRLGCSNPDVFAGVGAVSGPTVGSSQLMATGVPPTDRVQTGKTKCTSLASGKASHLDDQIMQVAYGMQDKDGGQSSGFSAGHKSLVSANWVHADVEVSQYMYGSGALSSETSIDNGGAYEKVSTKDGKTRVSIIRMPDVGHAWPSIDSSTNNTGDWINTTEFDYPSFVLAYFFDNNLRANRVPQGPDTVAPVITLNGNSAITVPQNGTYTDQGASALDDRDGDISANVVVGGDTVNTAVEGTYTVTYDVADAAGNDATQVTRTVTVQYIPDTTAPTITVLGDDPLEVKLGETFADPGVDAQDNVDGDISANVTVGGDTVDTNTLGNYLITYNVSDASGNAATEVTRLVQVVPNWTCNEVTDNNYNHVSAGRATTDYSYAYTVGSGENMGLWNLFTTTTLAETSDGYWEIGSCN